jgi:DNA modification methylase
LEKSYSGAGLGRNNNEELADILVTDPPYCLLHRRRKNGDLRDPKIRQKKLDDSDTVSFTEDSVKQNGLKFDLKTYALNSSDHFRT